MEKTLLELSKPFEEESDDTEGNSNVLDEEQLWAYSLLENTNKNYYITGKAGTGKSFLLKLFVKATNKKTLKLAPTGISALNVKGETIHSIFGFHNIEKLDIKDINIDNIKLKSEKKSVLKHVDTIIIDEISMVRSDVFDRIDRILRAINDNDMFFGGKQIIVFGDLYQLPPIANREETKYLKDKYGGIFFFFSNAYKNGDFTFIELTTNHRQKEDKVFFEILNRMREGMITNEDIDVLNKRVCVDEQQLRRRIRLLPKKDEVEKINKAELDTNRDAKEYTFKAEILFDKYKSQDAKVDSNFPITNILKLKHGSLVMMVNNHISKQWVNGTLAIISFINEEVIKVMIDGFEYEVHKSSFETQEAKYDDDTGRIEYETIFKIEQYPIVLAYAITIHKSQGKTYPSLACDIKDCFAPGQAYVALSRCSTLSGIFLLRPITRAEVSVDVDVKDFYIAAKQTKR